MTELGLGVTPRPDVHCCIEIIRDMFDIVEQCNTRLVEIPHTADDKGHMGHSLNVHAPPFELHRGSGFSSHIINESGTFETVANLESSSVSPFYKNPSSKTDGCKIALDPIVPGLGAAFRDPVPPKEKKYTSVSLVPRPICSSEQVNETEQEAGRFEHSEENTENVAQKTEEDIEQAEVNNDQSQGVAIDGGSILETNMCSINDLQKLATDAINKSKGASRRQKSFLPSDTCVTAKDPELPFLISTGSLDSCIAEESTNADGLQAEKPQESFTAILEDQEVMLVTPKYHMNLGASEINDVTLKQNTEPHTDDIRHQGNQSYQSVEDCGVDEPAMKVFAKQGGLCSSQTQGFSCLKQSSEEGFLCTNERQDITSEGVSGFDVLSEIRDVCNVEYSHPGFSAADSPSSWKQPLPATGYSDETRKSNVEYTTHCDFGSGSIFTEQEVALCPVRTDELFELEDGEGRLGIQTLSLGSKNGLPERDREVEDLITNDCEKAEELLNLQAMGTEDCATEVGIIANSMENHFTVSKVEIQEYENLQKVDSLSGHFSVLISEESNRDEEEMTSHYKAPVVMDCSEQELSAIKVTTDNTEKDKKEDLVQMEDATDGVESSETAKEEKRYLVEVSDAQQEDVELQSNLVHHEIRTSCYGQEEGDTAESADSHNSSATNKEIKSEDPRMEFEVGKSLPETYKRHFKQTVAVSPAAGTNDNFRCQSPGRAICGRAQSIGISPGTRPIKYYPFENKRYAVTDHNNDNIKRCEPIGAHLDIPDDSINQIHVVTSKMQQNHQTKGHGLRDGESVIGETSTEAVGTLWAGNWY